MRNILLFFCIGIVFAAAFAEDEEVENLARCRTDGERCNREHPCCTDMRCNDRTQKCEKRPDQTCRREGERCDRPHVCCPGRKCNQRTTKCEWDDKNWCKGEREPCERDSQCCKDLVCSISTKHCVKKDTFMFEDKLEDKAED